LNENDFEKEQAEIAEADRLRKEGQQSKGDISAESGEATLPHNVCRGSRQNSTGSYATDDPSQISGFADVSMYGGIEGSPNGTNRSDLVEGILPNTRSERPKTEFSISRSKSRAVDMNDPKHDQSRDVSVSVGDSVKMEGRSRTMSLQGPNASTVNTFFKSDDDDDMFTLKHKPLTKLEEHLDKKNQEIQAEESRKKQEEYQKLAAQVPSGKDELFEYVVDWNLLEKNDVINSKVRPWVRKKMIEFLGEEEPEVEDFIMKKISARPLPASLLKDLLIFFGQRSRRICYETLASYDIRAVEIERCLVFIA